MYSALPLLGNVWTCTPAFRSAAKAVSHSLSAVITTVTSTPRFAALSSAAVTVGSSISSFSTASVRCAASMTARIDACALVGDQTRSAPSGDPAGATRRLMDDDWLSGRFEENRTRLGA
jgi:hypothetical protein